MTLKASLKSVIGKMDSFSTVKKRESCYSLLLLSQGTWEPHEDPQPEKKDWNLEVINLVIGLMIKMDFFFLMKKECHIDFLFCCVLMR